MKYLTLLLILISCTPSRYLVVQYVENGKMYCRDEKGFEKYAEAHPDVYVEKGDTLVHVGGFRYYNITEH